MKSLRLFLRHRMPRRAALTIAPAVLAGTSFLAPEAFAASYSLTANDASGSSSFTSGFSPAFRLNGVAGNPATAPAAGNTYNTAAYILRGPANGTSYSFLGDSLTISSGGGRFLLKATGTTQILTVNNLILSGGVVDLANANNDGVAATIAGNATLTSSTTSYLGALIGETLTISSNISGSGNLTISSAGANSGGDVGTVILSGTNSYTGVTSILGSGGFFATAGGTLSTSSIANGGVNSGIGASSAASANLVIGQAGTLLYTGASTTTDRGFTLAANATNGSITVSGATVNTTNDLTFGGQIVAASGSTSSFTKEGAGTLTYTNASSTNTLSAGATGNGLGYVVNNGIVNFGGTSAVPVNQTNTIGGTGQLIIGTTNSASSPSAELDINSGTTNVSSYAGVGRGNGTNGAASILRLNNNATLNSVNFSSGFDNGVANFKSNTQVYLNGTSTFTDTGVFRVGESVNAGTNNFYVNDSATLSVSGGFSVSRAGTSIFTQNGGTVTASSGIAFADTSSVGNGTYNLNGGTLNTTFLNKGSGAGTVNFNGGTVQALANDSPGAATPVVFLTGVTANVLLGGATINTNGFNVSAAAGLVHAAAGTDGGLTKLGAGTLKLTALNTYNGTTTVSAGTLQVDSGSTGPSTAGSLSASGTLQLNGGTLLLSGAVNINDRLNDSAAVHLNEGTLALAGVAEGGGGSNGLAATGAAGVGALTLQTSSIIDLQGTSLLHLAASGSQAWTGTLSVYNYSGATGGNGSEQLLFGSDDSAASLTTTQLSQITFYSDGGTILLGTATFAGLGDGEIVPTPVPEPATWAGGVLLVLSGLKMMRQSRARIVLAFLNGYSGFQNV